MRVATMALNTRQSQPTGYRNANKKEESITVYISALVRSSMGS